MKPTVDWKPELQHTIIAAADAGHQFEVRPPIVSRQRIEQRVNKVLNPSRRNHCRRWSGADWPQFDVVMCLGRHHLLEASPFGWMECNPVHHTFPMPGL